MSAVLRERRVGRLLAAAAVAAVVALTYARLFDGIDFTDEAFYVAVPYRLVLGARPFVDEIDVTQQTSAVLVYPFVRAYHAAAGTTGIVLFVRNLQFVLSLLVAAAVTFSLRRLLGASRAVLVGVAAVAFVPFDIHSLSYNTLGSGLFTAACLLGFRGTEPSGRRLALAAAAACLALAVFAYPPLVLAGAAAGVAWVARGDRRRTAALGALALLLPAAGLGTLAGLAGPDRVADAYQSSERDLGQGGGLGKLVSVASHQASSWRFWYLVVTALVLVAVAWRRRRVAALPFLLVLPALAWPRHAGVYTASLHYVAVYGWFALPLYPAVRRRRGASGLLAAVWLPALAAGVTTAYSSANGSVNFGVGFFPAAVVTTVFLVWAVEDGGLPRWASAAPALCVLALLVFMGRPVYRDGPPAALRARVHGGAFAGLLTSPRKRAFLAGLRRDLAGAGAGCRILFFDDFPAGYLLTAARPDTNAVWTASVPPARAGSYQGALVRYYRDRRFPDVVVMMRRVPYAAPSSARLVRYSPGAPLLVMLRRRRYRPVVERFDYSIYAERDSARLCGAHL